MPANKNEIQQDAAIWQLAELIAGQRGEQQWQQLRQRTREAYARALIERMHEVRADLKQEKISGVDLFNTLNGPLSVRKEATWENVPQQERDLYSQAVQRFNETLQTPIQEGSTQTNIGSE